MGEDHTLREVENLRIDALYGKKKHFNAADRKEMYNSVIGVALIIANAVIASTLIYLLSPSIPISNIVVSIIGFTATVLAVVQVFFNYSRTAEQHKTVATKYLHIAKECSRIKAYYLDGSLTIDDLRELLESLAQKYGQITEDAICLATSQRDYEKARKGIEDGEEKYSPGEYQEE
jgi:predicted nucleic acid-binding protein